MKAEDASSAFADWRPAETAPTDGSDFLAELSNGWVRVLNAGKGVRLGWPNEWWSGRGIDVPFEPSHAPDADYHHFPRLTGWMLLPKSRQQIARDAEEKAIGE